jgi:hypothetical protein
MSVTGPTSGAGRFEPDPQPAAADEAAAAALASELAAIRGPSGGAAGVRALGERLARDGRIDANDVKALVTAAKDYGTITSQEKQALVQFLRDHGNKFSPEAREALSRFLGLAPSRPPIGGAPPATPTAPPAPANPALAAINAKIPEIAGHRYELSPAGYMVAQGGASRAPAFDKEGAERIYRAGNALMDAPQGVLRGAGAETQQKLLEGTAALYDRAAERTLSSGVMPEDATKLRSGAAATMLAVIEGADTPAVMQAAARAYLDRAANEPDERLRASMYRNILPLKGSLSTELAARVDALKARVIPEKPPYDEWFKNGNKTLEVRQYAHPDCWQYGPNPIEAYQQMGLRVTNHTTEHGEETWELSGSIRDTTGRNPPQPVHIKVYKTHDEFMRDMDDPNVHAIFYTGHSNLGGNVSEAVRRGPAENGTKLVHLGMCRGQQNMYEFANKYPHAQLTTTHDPHYFHNMMRAVTGTLQGIARRDTWEGIDRSTQMESNNLIRPNQMRRYEFLDEDRDGRADAGPQGQDRFYDVLARVPPRSAVDLVPRAETRAADDIDGSPVMDGVNFARTLLTYHVEHGPGASKLGSVEGDRFFANGWFEGDPAKEPVRITEGRGTDGKPIYQVQVNKAFAGQSRYAIGALVQFEIFKQLSQKATGGTFTADDKARALLATGEYLSYMYCTETEADGIMKAIGERVGIRGLDYAKARAAIDADDHGYVTDEQVRALVRRLGIR